MNTPFTPDPGWATEWLTHRDWSGFLGRHQLDAGYLKQASVVYAGLIEAIHHTRERLGRPIIVGINGAQGSGKSTLADWLVHAFRDLPGKDSPNWHALALSIDDFYLTRHARQQLAQSIHPLLKTRGVPGTHDMTLALETLDRLTGSRQSVRVPRFDKASDDRLPEHEWPVFQAPLDLIVVEGWCLGISAEPTSKLTEPVNDLERIEDPDRIWRTYVNQQLTTQYPSLYDRIDLWVMLRAPGFGAVYDWRVEQEHKLAATVQSRAGNDRTMSDAEIHRFIQHYQRLTEHGLKTVPDRVHFLYELDQQRQVTHITHPVRLDS